MNPIAASQAPLVSVGRSGTSVAEWTSLGTDPARFSEHLPRRERYAEPPECVGGQKGERHQRPNRLRVRTRSEEHTSELQSQSNLVCRLLLEKKKNKQHDSG